MANVQSQFGFRHIGFTSGASPDYQLATRLISSANTTKIFRGDVVNKVTGTGYIKQAAAGATQPCEGVFDGCVYIPVGGGTPQWSPFWPGSAASDATAYVINAPNALFLAATFLTSLQVSNIGSNIDFNVAAGSQVGGGFSGMTLDQATATATPGTSITLPFQVYSLYQGIGNGSDPTTNFDWAVVTFNNERFRSLVGFP